MTSDTAALPPAGLLRRLAAMLSDSLVVFGLLALTTLFLFVPLLSLIAKKAMTPGEVGWPWFSVYLLVMLITWFGFFGYFWTRGGQTVGMRAWRIRVEASNGATLDWTQAGRRWCYAWLPWMPALIVLIVSEQFHSGGLKHLGFGLGLLGVVGLAGMYVDPLKRSWHDRMSDTRTVLLPRR